LAFEHDAPVERKVLKIFVSQIAQAADLKVLERSTDSRVSVRGILGQLNPSTVFVTHLDAQINVIASRRTDTTDEKIDININKCLFLYVREFGFRPYWVDSAAKQVRPRTGRGRCRDRLAVLC